MNLRMLFVIMKPVVAVELMGRIFCCVLLMNNKKKKPNGLEVVYNCQGKRYFGIFTEIEV